MPTNEHKTTSMHRRITQLMNPLSVIVLVGFILRVYAINYGLPRLYLEDEEFFVRPALHIADGAWNPGWFGAPAQTLIYALGFLFRAVNAVLNLVHHTNLATSQMYALQTSIFQISGRMLGVIAGTLMIVVAYGIALHWSKRAAYWAAGLVATSFYLVFNSHIIRPDIIQSLFLLCIVYTWFRIIDAPRARKWYIWFGVALGLAVNTKYPSLFFVFPLVAVIVVLIRQKQFMFTLWFQAAVTSVATSFITGPFLYLRFHDMLKSVENENRIGHGGHDGWNFIEQLRWYVLHVLQWQVGSFLYVCAGIAIVTIIVRLFKKTHTTKEVKFALVFVAALSYLLCISKLHLHWERWVIPVTTLLLILAAVGIDILRTRFILRPVVWILIYCIILAGPTMRLARTLYGLSQPYTTEIARTWIIDNMPKRTKFVTEPYAPQLPSDEYKVLKLGNLSWHKIRYYQNHNIMHAIVTEKVYGLITGETDPDSPAYFGNTFVAKPYYERLTGMSTLIYQIRSHPVYTADQLLYSNDVAIFRTLQINLLIGPYIRIYQLPPLPPEQTTSPSP